MVWPLLEVVDASLHEPWARSLAAHLGATDDAVRRARRFSSVRHLAELFDRYALHRPALVQGWLAGETGEHWQAQLWLRLRERIAGAEPRGAARGGVRAAARRPGLRSACRRGSRCSA